MCSSGRTNRQWLAERSRFQGLLSICQRREATCIQHLQALPSNLSASFYNAERVTWVKCRVTRVKCRFLPTFAHPSANGWRQLTSSRRSFPPLCIILPTAGDNLHLAYARASFLLLCISLPSPGGNCHPAFAGVSFQPPCIPLPTAGGNLHATSAGAIFQPLCIPLPTAGGNWFNWHQTLAGSCFQYLCISPPTAGSNLQTTVHELRYSLACSNVVVGQAARRTFAGASFQTKLRLTFILHIRCCRHMCS